MRVRPTENKESLCKKHINHLSSEKLKIKKRENVLQKKKKLKLPISFVRIIYTWTLFSFYFSKNIRHIFCQRATASNILKCSERRLRKWLFSPILSTMLLPPLLLIIGLDFVSKKHLKSSKRIKMAG